MFKKPVFYKTSLIIIFVNFFSILNAQSLILNDQLNGSTVGTRVGGSYTTEGYKPGIGTNHILYTIPARVPNGYVEFEIKGFSPSDISGTKNDHGFIMMYDGRGIGNTPTWAQFRDNYFRWNFHWRQSTSTFKCVVNTAAPTSSRLNSSYAIFNNDRDGDGDVDMQDRDWFDEPNGSSFSWDKNKWYVVKLEWNNKTYKVFVDGRNVWSNHIAGLYDYSPIDFKVWLGSGVDKYDSDNANVIYRNFKVYSYGGSTTPVNNLSVSPSSQNVNPSAGNTSFSVTSNIAWNVSDNASWLSVSPSSGNNSGSLTATFNENTSTSSRTATITILGGGITRTVNVIQAGQSNGGNVDVLTVSPSSQNVSTAAGSTSFNVSSNVSWNVNDNADWLTISPISGSNNGSLTASFSQNTSTSARTATVTITGSGLTRNVSIVQAGVTNSGGSNFIDVISSLNLSKDAGNITVDVKSNVEWTVRDNAGAGVSGWISKTPKIGVGNGVVTVRYTANTSSDSRTASLIFTGGGITKTTIITQAGSSSGSGGQNFIDVPSSLNISASTRSISLNVSSNVNWTVRDDAGINGWITKTPKSGTGNGILSVKFLINATGQSRSANLIFTGGGITKSVKITQSASVSLTKNNNSIDENGVEIKDSPEIPNEFAVTNYPNPFNPTTTIQYSLPVDGFTELTIYNSLGEVMAKPLSEFRSKGTYNLLFNASHFSSGIYFYTLQSGNFIKTSKMILME